MCHREPAPTCFSTISGTPPWSDGHLTKGLTLLSDPSEDYSTSICSTFSMTVEQRKAARDRLLQAVK